MILRVDGCVGSGSGDASKLSALQLCSVFAALPSAPVVVAKMVLRRWFLKVATTLLELSLVPRAAAAAIFNVC